MYWRLFKKEMLLSFRQRTQYFTALAFYIIVISLFPLTINPDAKLLHQIGAGIIWIAALLSVLLSLPVLFYEDFRDGSLEQMRVSASSMAIQLLLKLSANWVFTCFPLILLTPLLGLFYGFSPIATAVMMLSLLLGTPTLLLLGGIGAALTLVLRNSGSLLALMILPMYIPILIFGNSAVQAAGNMGAFGTSLAMLSAMLVLAILLAPLAIVYAMKLTLEYS